MRGLPALLAGLLLASVTDALALSVNKAGCQRIATGPGPEDMVLLPGTPARLLLSSHDRRHFDSSGNIYLYDTASGAMRPLPRLDEPAGLPFRPHGITVVERGGQTLLYVVSHDEAQPNGTHHSILVYALRDDGLHWQQRLQDPLLSSPDSVSVTPDGSVYVSNNRKDGSSVMELALHRSRANVVLYQPGHGWRIVADGLEYPNGLLAEPNRVLLSLTFGGEFLLYPRQPDGSLGKPHTVAERPNLDNISPAPDADSYLVSSHNSFVDFMRHKNSSASHSGNTIYEFNVRNDQATQIWSDDGSLISAVSTALVADRKLYLSQDFDAFIVSCPLTL